MDVYNAVCETLESLISVTADDTDCLIAELESRGLVIVEKHAMESARGALAGMVDMYTAMINSGDCGHWDPEKDREVIAARAALKLAEPTP